MKRDLCFPDKTRIAHEILAYLVEHPEAQDTLEGIVQWWLLERKIKYQEILVKEALTKLVQDGYLRIDKQNYANTKFQHDKEKSYLYSIDQTKKEEIQTFINQRERD